MLVIACKWIDDQGIVSLDRFREHVSRRAHANLEGSEYGERH